MILIATLTTCLVLTSAFGLLLWTVLRTHQASLDRLVGTLEREQQAHREETQMLLQRIQAPHQAVVQHAQQTAGPAPSGLPLTEEESAMAQDQALQAKAVLDQIKAMEADENLTAFGLVNG